MNVLRRFSEIEDRDKSFARSRPLGLPRPNISLLQNLMSLMTVLIYSENFFVGNERRCCCIVARQIATEDQRRTEDAPQRHHRSLLVWRELRRSTSAFLVGYT